MRVLQLFILLMVLIPTESVSQIDYDKIRSKKLQPIHIDTIREDMLVVEKRYATLYFRQKDVKDYIEQRDSKSNGSSNYGKLLEFIIKSEKRRLIDWWYDYTDEDRVKLFGNPNYTNENRKTVDELYYIGADLIHDGKFMIIDKASGEEKKKGLKIKRVKGLFGTRYVDFTLPNGKRFWNIVTRLGE